MTQIREFYDSLNAVPKANAWLKKHPEVKVVNTSTRQAPLGGGHTVTITFEAPHEIDAWD